MACRILILDFDRQDLFQAADPESIARAGESWAHDIRSFGFWSRTLALGSGDAGNETDQWSWQPENPGNGPAVLVCGHCTSTMDAAWYFINNLQINIWDSIIAVAQTAGRGQQKRHWVSPAGNIHASWLWPLPEFSGKTAINWDGLLPLIAGFIFARVFKELNIPVQIKWPNDLLINNRKFAGILAERRNSHILVGIGINVAYAPEDSRLREDFAIPATHLADQGFEMSPLCLWTALVEKGRILFDQLIRTLTPAEFVRMIDMQMAWVGKNVLIRGFNSDVSEGVILGLAEDGGLRIKKKSIEEVMYSGSIIPVR